MTIYEVIRQAQECLHSREPLILKIPFRQREVLRQRRLWGHDGPWGRVLETYDTFALVSFDAQKVYDWAVHYAKRKPK